MKFVPINTMICVQNAYLRVLAMNQLRETKHVSAFMSGGVRRNFGR